MPNLSRGRYTWWDNKPGEDVFTWNPRISGYYRIWISWGTHGSGVHTRDARYVLDRDGNLETRDDQQIVGQADQYYFAGQSEGESEKIPLWSGLLDVGVHEWSETSRLILRGGETGTGITADVIVLQEVSTETQNASPLPLLRETVDYALNREKFVPVSAKYVRFTTFATEENNRYEPCLDELEVYSSGPGSTNIALATNGTIPSSSGNYSDTGRHQLMHINDGVYGNPRSWISNEKGAGWVQLEFPQPYQIDRINWSRDREGKLKDRLPIDYQISVSLDGQNWQVVATGQDRLPQGTPNNRAMQQIRQASGESAHEIKAIEKSLNDLKKRKEALEKPELAYAGVFRQPDETFLLNRGDPEQPLEKLAPGVPDFLGVGEIPEGVSEPERRRLLADWIASPDNPLTARVMVNRIWQMHFGTGLVETPSDFGLNGASPSHPELLDWLAQEFIEGNWSVKQMHRLIMTSNAYLQTARIRPEGLKQDRDNRLLWRFPSRRLEAEAIRDSMLAVSGELNLKMGGPGFDFFKTRGGLSGFPPVDEYGPEQLRRMIYSHKIRMEPVPVFGIFDCPDAGQPMPQRSQSTTALQALNLFNSPFVIERADVIAKRIEGQTAGNPADQVEQMFELVLGRPPEQTERSAAMDVIQQHGLSVLSRVLLNSNEFLFLP